MENKYAHIIFWLLAGLLIGEFWHFFDSDKVHLVNWFVRPPKNLPDITWYVKEIGDSVTKICWFYAMYLGFARLNTKLAGIVICFIFYFTGELFLFFWCYKVYGYFWLYVACGAFVFLTLIWKTKWIGR